MYLLFIHHKAFAAFELALPELAHAGGKQWELHRNSYEVAFKRHVASFNRETIATRLKQPGLAVFPADILKRIKL